MTCDRAAALALLLAGCASQPAPAPPPAVAPPIVTSTRTEVIDMSAGDFEGEALIVVPRRPDFDPMTRQLDPRKARAARALPR